MDKLIIKPRFCKDFLHEVVCASNTFFLLWSTDSKAERNLLTWARSSASSVAKVPAMSYEQT